MICAHKPAIDTNYALHLPLFDRIFGTYHMPDEHWPLQLAAACGLGLLAFTVLALKLLSRRWGYRQPSRRTANPETL